MVETSTLPTWSTNGGVLARHYFKVKDASDNIYILHFDEPHAAWELVVFMSKRGTTLPDLFAKHGPKRSLPAFVARC